MTAKTDNLHLMSNVVLAVPAHERINAVSFLNNKSNFDEVNISNKSEAVSKEKSNNKKKNRLISAGITLGVIVVGIAAKCIKKKFPNFLTKKNKFTILEGSGETSNAVKSFPSMVKNKDGGIELRADNSFYNGEFHIYNSNGEYVGECVLGHGPCDIGITGKEVLPNSWIVNGEIKPFLEIGELLIYEHGNSYGRKTMQALYELSLDLGYEGRLALAQLDTANGFYTKMGFSNEDNMFRFFTPTKESLAKLYKTA